ncbi:uncharacterized protein BO96DRAFT_438417 [Aspergillus niger CBS 101883]|uniref:uncharacterized protein n=1 Tax=Aspergillus lacticoffeatus (strain CBS 101883) TaxID=1450533 RepID=UPI000D7EE9BA|nr:uncharacterized protein BO96DRAFT_438417 [Aspergillus niger CBS 101883]PYH52133.1 hypothetical protein BO96DRAFT_438417 [Aspergillus niger CBS 101883]
MKKRSKSYEEKRVDKQNWVEGMRRAEYLSSAGGSDCLFTPVAIYAASSGFPESEFQLMRFSSCLDSMKPCHARVLVTQSVCSDLVADEDSDVFAVLIGRCVLVSPSRSIVNKAKMLHRVFPSRNPRRISLRQPINACCMAVSQGGCSSPHQQ